MRKILFPARPDDFGLRSDITTRNSGIPTDGKLDLEDLAYWAMMVQGYILGLTALPTVTIAAAEPSTSLSTSIASLQATVATLSASVASLQASINALPGYYHGNGEPPASLGADGSTYNDDLTQMRWAKIAGSWVQ